MGVFVTAVASMAVRELREREREGGGIDDRRGRQIFNFGSYERSWRWNIGAFHWERDGRWGPFVRSSGFNWGWAVRQGIMRIRCEERGERDWERKYEEVHAVLSRLVLHLHEDDLSVRQACRVKSGVLYFFPYHAFPVFFPLRWCFGHNTLKQIASFVDSEEFFTLFTSHYFHLDHRSDYEDFIRDLTRHFCQRMPSRIDTYMASAIQAFDAPWPIIQANAIYFSGSMLSQTDDQRILSLYYSQVFGMLVGKMSRSTDAIVRAACSSSLGMLLKSSNSLFWRSIRLDQADSNRKGS
ncbi:hypothetical protein Cgig2_011875 [Carnegiea gigantea]|uniref:Maestro/Maestro-like HEAT-repeats domain-containing protein n=1 Tax=Carnegiea gigantea TaxID=171969 RepID=A0A9Q1K9A4_9CARY|nr:hypothetical protein Cgig2_011875 [Carnegiea gigantea]